MLQAPARYSTSRTPPAGWRPPTGGEARAGVSMGPSWHGIDERAGNERDGPRSTCRTAPGRFREALVDSPLYATIHAPGRAVRRRRAGHPDRPRGGSPSRPGTCGADRFRPQGWLDGHRIAGDADARLLGRVEVEQPFRGHGRVRDTGAEGRPGS